MSSNRFDELNEEVLEFIRTTYNLKIPNKFKRNKVYVTSLFYEHIVKEWIKVNFAPLNWLVIESSNNDDATNDVDFILIIDNRKYNVSVKWQNKALDTGNLSFELENILAEGVAKDAWYRTGKADIYLFIVGDSVYWVERKKLVEYVTINDFDRTCGLSSATKAHQWNSNHTHKDSINGLIKISRLIDAGVAEIICDYFTRLVNGALDDVRKRLKQHTR